MTGAMDAGISGLQVHMSKMNVIGNNIANVNTYGYKNQRTVFADSIYSTLYAGSNGTTTIGGSTPSQIGYGVRLSSIDLNMSTGTFSPTGKPTDCMIDGDGFFLVGDKTVQYTIDANDPESLKALTLTRVGNIEFKADNYLCDGNNNVVYGFLCTGIYTQEDIDADAEAVAAGGESSIPAGTKAGDLKFSNQLVPICLPRVQIDENGNYEVVYPKEDEVTGYLTAGTGEDGEELPFAALDSISIDPATGRISGIVKDTDEVVIVGYIAIGNVANPNGVTHIGDSYYKAMEGAGDLSVTLLGGAEKTAGITYIGNGLRPGDEDFDPNNLPSGSRVGSAGTTSLMTGGLEGSKVDLATEIAELIKTQRGYQANTRIVTVTDSMLEELINMKR